MVILMKKSNFLKYYAQLRAFKRLKQACDLSARRVVKNLFKCNIFSMPRHMRRSWQTYKIAAATLPPDHAVDSTVVGSVG